jgi:hypothetical protein
VRHPEPPSADLRQSAVTGILRSLPAATGGRVIQEAPTAQGPHHLLRLLEALISWQDGSMTAVRMKALAGILALAPALLAEAPAHAAPATLPTITSAAASRTDFVLSASGGCGDITFTAVLSAPMPAGDYVSGVGVRLYAPGRSGANSYAGVEFGQVADGSTTYSGSVRICGNYLAPGRGHAEVYGVAIPAGGGTTLHTNTVTIGISVKRPSTLAFNASPEPVKKGKKITAAGTLKVDGKTLAHATVRIYFKKSGTSTYARKSTLTTNRKGAFRTHFTASKSGTWKAVYDGGSTRQASSKADAVAVS